MEFSYYSLAIDESTDATDTAQLLVFVRGIDDNFDASEELAGMQSMQGRTTGKDICSAIIDCVTKKLSSDFKKLVGLCTDGAPAMCGKRNGAAALLQATGFATGYYWKKGYLSPLHYTSASFMQQGFRI